METTTETQKEISIYLSANRTKSVNRNGKVTSAVLTCHTSGAEPEIYTDEEVLAAVLKYVPENLGAAVVTEAVIVEYHGAGVYEIEVNYEQQNWANSGKRSLRRHRDEKWFLAASNSVEHILFGENTWKYGNNPPSVGNLIGWNGKSGSSSSASGANIISAAIRENCVLTLKRTEFNFEFRKKILSLTGHTNSLPFHGWERGEVLFLGASSGMPYVNDDEDELVDVTLKFAVRQNRGHLYVNGHIFSARGWEVVWPVGQHHVYVSQVYPESDFNILGVGRNGY